MSNTVITGQQIEDGTVGRVDLNIITSGNSVIAKALENGGAVTLTSTGADAGTGDVTIIHRTTAGYNHIPTGGASTNVLAWSSSGVAAWSTLSAITGVTETALSTGFSVAGGTTSKILTVSNTLTLAGTDSSTLNIGAGGTLGTAAYTASSAYQATSSWLTSIIGLTYVSASFVKMTAANTFTLDTNTYVVSGGALGTPSSGTLTSCTFPILNQSTTGTANIAGGTVGAVPYQTGAAATGVVAATATASKMFLSGASAIPTWSTSTIPTSAGATALKHLRSDGTNYILTTATISDSPSTAGKVLVSDGTNWITSTPTFPNASATTRKIIVSDGTNWVASTETYAIPGTSGNLLTSDGTNWTSAAPVFGAATTNTVTNKRIQERTYTTTSTATLTPEVATYDMFVLTAQAAALTIANQSTSTPVDGEDMTFRIKDNATARAITYGTNYRSLVATMPTTTVLSKWLYIAFKWNATDSKWDCMAAGSQP